MNARRALVLVVVLALLGSGLAIGAASGSARTGGASNLSVSTTAVKANLSGPTVLGLGGTGVLRINASGGPAFATNGSLIGNLTYYTAVAGINTTGVLITPAQDLVTNGSANATVEANQVAQVLTISVMVSSTYLTQNESINLTWSFHVVQPYVVAATIVASSSATVLSFDVDVALDGTIVGTVSVPEIVAGGSYDLSYSYISLGLSSGWHTFTISLASEHGLVTFANGATAYSVSIYVPGTAPNYTVWYVLGIVAFFGVSFIIVTRVAARRRGLARR